MNTTIFNLSNRPPPLFPNINSRLLTPLTGNIGARNEALWESIVASCVCVEDEEEGGEEEGGGELHVLW